MWISKRGWHAALLTSHDMKTTKKVLKVGRDQTAFLTDVSKGFDCLLHDLLITKLHAYGVKKCL